MNGTSFSAPYIAGVFAVACQAAGTLYNTAGTAASLYTALRNTGTIGTVTNTNGTPLTGATSRFIRQQW
ncbi:MAG: S8 family serine peptidase [Nitrosomonas sp.]|nr:S8 family serine peptidase [Nitrosomonas sp.]